MMDADALYSRALICLGGFFMSFGVAEVCGVVADETDESDRARQERVEAFVEKLVPSKQEELEEYMEDVIGAMDEVVVLGEEEEKVLEVAAEKAIARSLEPWPKAFREALDAWFKMVPLEDLEVSLLHGGLGELTRHTPVAGCVLPDRQRVWEKSVSGVLDEERLSEWNEVVSKEREKRRREIEGKLREWQGRWKDSIEKPLKGQIEQMKEAFELGDADLEVLREEMEGVAKTKRQEDIAKVRGMLGFLSDRAWNRMKGQGHFSFEMERKEDRDAIEADWEDAVRGVLGKARHAKWERMVDESAKEREEKMGRYLAPQVDRVRTEIESGMELEIREIAQLLALPEKREEKLQALSKRAVDVSLEKAEESWREQLRGLTDEVLEGRIMQGNYHYGISTDDWPQRQGLWTEGLANLLGEDELVRLEEAREARDGRREGALARIVVVELDKMLSLTPRQRRELEPLMKPVTTIFPRRTSHGYWGVNPSQLFRAAGRLEEADVRAVIDDVQWARWREICVDRQKNGRELEDEAGDEEEGKGTSDELPDVEAVLSEHLFKLSEGQRDKFMGQMQIKIDDVTRVLDLSPGDVTRLTTAAKGAVEQSTSRAMGNAERWLRNSVEGATPKNIEKVLASQRHTSFGRVGGGPYTDEIWTEALDDVLSAKERERWEKAVADRDAYLEESLIRMTLSEFEIRRRTTESQMDEIEPMLREAFENYLPDINNYVSGSWYLQSYYAMLPFGGIPEENLKEILTEAQWKEFEMKDMAEVSNYWSGIQSNHERRVKEKKKK
ncbi:MAG: hypothetical protein AAGD22_07220 [Verrucomicrobiota bacterium]